MPSSPANFHVYVMRGLPNGGWAPHPIARCEEDGLGACLRVLHEEAQITARDTIGILMRDSGEERGTWLVNPFS